jgi:hypothetical protein
MGWRVQSNTAVIQPRLVSDTFLLRSALIFEERYLERFVGSACFEKSGIFIVLLYDTMLIDELAELSVELECPLFVLGNCLADDGSEVIVRLAMIIGEYIENAL